MSSASQPLPASAKPDSLLASDHFIAWLLAAAALLLQMLTNGRYGYFRDELYFLACSNHLAWGYVDFAPLVAILARISCFTLGDSLHAIRTLPALAQAAEILLTGLIARELGGKRFAIFLSCLSVLLAPVILGNATRLSMNAFEPIFWMAQSTSSSAPSISATQGCCSFPAFSSVSAWTTNTPLSSSLSA